MFRINRANRAVLPVLWLLSCGPCGAAETTASLAGDRVSTGVRAISENPANRLSPVPLGAETFTSFTLEPGVRVTVQAPLSKIYRPKHVVLYLLPNGNTTEQSLGRDREEGLDWHYGIQHIAAQTRRVRELWTSRTVITAVVEADTLSWPAWRKAVDGADKRIMSIVEEIRNRAGGEDATIDLVAHSGGGSFIWGFLNAHEAIPEYVKRIVFLDANYSYSDEEGHGDKFVAWLKQSPENKLTVFAYDDRGVTINGKPIVSETGGTWRATDRMARRLEQDFKFLPAKLNDLQTSKTADGRILLARHPNPETKILHTVLVEKNGFVYGVLTDRVTISESELPFSRDEGYRTLIK